MTRRARATASLVVLGVCVAAVASRPRVASEEVGAHAVPPRLRAISDAPTAIQETAECVDAYSRVCGPAGETDAGRSSRSAAVTAAIHAEALAVLVQTNSFAPLTVQGWQTYVDAQEPRRRETLERSFAKVENTLVAERIAPLRDAARSEHARLRDLAIAVVSVQLDPPRRAAAVERLRASTLRWPDPDGGIDRGMRAGCGDDLLVDDAWIDKRAIDVTLCPGLLLVSVDEPRRPDTAFRRRIAFMLAHELGHVIAGPLFEGRETEASADRWATELIAADIAEIDEPSARDDYLQRSLEPICYAGEDATHDSARARIDIVAHNPVIAATLDLWAR